MKNYYRFFENKECEYYPCHKMNEINCIFCYCPLYFIKECGGNYSVNQNGIKDCKNCSVPHIPEKGYDYVLQILSKYASKTI